MKKITIILLMLSNLSVSMASDLVREKRMYNQIVDAILDGDVEMLTADGHEFLSIYTQAEDARGAVLILHGRGFHPDWADVVNPLRVGLAEQGWNTLSIQLPVLDKTAKYYDYVPVFDEAVPRIEAAIDFLKQQGNDKVILLAHSCGAHMAMQYVRKNGEQDYDAFIGIGMGATDYKQPMREPFPFERMSKPLLDIFGADDYPAVHRLAAIRAQQVLGDANPKSKQVKIPQANHYFTDMGEPLLDQVVEWLGQL